MDEHWIGERNEKKKLVFCPNFCVVSPHSNSLRRAGSCEGDLRCRWWRRLRTTWRLELDVLIYLAAYLIWGDASFVGATSTRTGLPTEIDWSVRPDSKKSKSGIIYSKQGWWNRDDLIKQLDQSIVTHRWKFWTFPVNKTRWKSSSFIDCFPLERICKFTSSTSDVVNISWNNEPEDKTKKETTDGMGRKVLPDASATITQNIVFFPVFFLPRSTSSVHKCTPFRTQSSIDLSTGFSTCLLR